MAVDLVTFGHQVRVIGPWSWKVVENAICGRKPDRKKISLLRDKYFREDSRIRYLHSKSLNMRRLAVNDEILKNVINICTRFSISMDVMAS